MHRVAGLYRARFGHCSEQLDTIIAQLQLSLEDPSELPPSEPPPQTMTKADTFSETVNNRLVKLELLGSSLRRKNPGFYQLVNSAVERLCGRQHGSRLSWRHTTRVPDLFRLLIKAGQADV